MERGRGIYIYYDSLQVQEADLNTACEVLAGNFRITREGVLDSMEIVVDPSRIRHPSGGANGCKPRPITHPITCLDRPFYVTSMDTTSLSTHALTVLGEAVFVLLVLYRTHLLDRVQTHLLDRVLEPSVCCTSCFDCFGIGKC